MVLKTKFYIFRLFLISFLIIACSKESTNTGDPIVDDKEQQLTIFHINDQHGRILNFAKIKHIIDEEKKKTEVLFVCAGDVFSGNPVVDNHDEKGFPMIDLMNKSGVDVAVIGNHEFDYGEAILDNRVTQSDFEWICANVNTGNSVLNQPEPFVTVNAGDLKITFLGLVETFGSDTEIIPSTHPWRVQHLEFERHHDIVPNYSNLKSDENADLYVALTHIGEGSDFNLATNHPYFDIIIGGHSHTKVNTTVNSIPVFQAGSNLEHLGKIELTIKNKKIVNFSHELIDLNNYSQLDSTLDELAQSYENSANLDEVISTSATFHSRAHVGNFYTDVLMKKMQVNFSIQNTGGIRNSMDAGPITKRTIYTIDPFNNGSVTYTMSIGEIKKFLRETNSGVYYAGLKIVKDGSYIDILNMSNESLDDSVEITIGLNDYIPAVHAAYFSDPVVKPYTTAEGIINYLETNQQTVNYTGFTNYFKYN